jgi:hypothetical protein
MTKNKIIILLAIVTSLLVSIPSLLNIAQGAEYDLSKLETKGTEELVNDIQGKNFDELIEDINGYDFTPESEALFHYAAEVVWEIKDVEETEIVTAINDDANSEIAKVTIIQACTESEIEIPYEEVISLVYNDETPFEIKRNLLINNVETGADVDLLKNIAIGDNELAVQALQLLNNESPEDALIIVEESLDSYENISDMELIAALDVKALALRSKYQSSERMDGGRQYHGRLSKLTSEVDGIGEFIAICDDVLNNRNTKEAKYGAMFALSDVLNEETITYIVESDLFEHDIKIFCIDQNTVILKEMLEKTPTPEKISVVLKAMEIMPLNDLRDPLEHLLPIVDSEMAAAILITLDNIESNGENSVIGIKMFE